METKTGSPSRSHSLHQSASGMQHQFSASNGNNQEENTTGEKKSATLYDELRQECQAIEEHMREAELEILKREEDAFLAIRFEQEISRLQTLQAVEMREKKLAFEKQMAARAALQKSKRMQKQLFRDIKKRDSVIMQQEEAARAKRIIQDQLSDKAKMFEQHLANVEAKHEKQRRQLIASQDRTISYEKTLHDLETKNKKEEMRSAMDKNFQAQLNHQKALDKRLLDHQREIQLLELRHLKERADLEEKALEETGSLRIAHSNRIVETRSQHVTEMHLEKDRMNEVKQSLKITALENQFAAEMKKLIIFQRNQLRQLRQQHVVLMKQRKVKGTSTTKGEEQSNIQQQQTGKNSRASRQASRAASVAPSVDSLNGDEDENGSEIDIRQSTIIKGKVGNKRFQSGLSEHQDEEEEDGIKMSPELMAMQENIKRLASRQKEAMDNLISSQKEEAEKLRLLWVQRGKELDDEQAAEMANAKETQEKEIADMFAAQEREIQMEAAVHDTELKMMMERRLLNSVLDTVVDAIITIDVIGTIKRFNAAAEKMFGYTAAEVIEKNIRDLMPEEYSVHHDEYLNNYMVTGVKKVIGKGRRAHGLRKDRSTFPLYLSISEVKDEGVHLFTGIVRDMTKEVEIERNNAEFELQKLAEKKQILSELEESNQISTQIQTRMIPKVEKNQQVISKRTDNCTVLMAEIVQFEKLTSMLNPAELIELLNVVDDMVNEVVAQYDAYRVENEADKIIIVSGTPFQNGDAHAGILATIALHLHSVISSITVKSSEEINLQIQAGIITGPLIGGAVGLDVPRYCLFGDTMDRLNRLVSLGASSNVILSEQTQHVLAKSTEFSTKSCIRGEKGKDKQLYWLLSKDNLPFESKPLATILD
ncbi:hypothetical protein HK098_007706 [Nowakowskiella sp. JEL0407]|nr:hypothetical protein HK098_007706 [Nowakowskiella sp. JEL0407]